MRTTTVALAPVSTSFAEERHRRRRGREEARKNATSDRRSIDDARQQPVIAVLSRVTSFGSVVRAPRPVSSSSDIAGVTVSATSSEATMATTYDSASGRKNAPDSPSSVNTGKNTAMTIRTIGGISEVGG
jgi:hypothetical protein